MRFDPSLFGDVTRGVAQNEARKRRDDERLVVGCSEEWPVILVSRF